MTRIGLACVLGLLLPLLAVGCSKDPDPTPDPMVDRPDAFLSLTCDEWLEQLDRLVSSHQSCETAEDCAVVGEVEPACECGSSFVVAINKDYEREAQVWFDKLGNCIWMPCTGCALEPVPTCDNGRCTPGDTVVCCDWQ